MLFSCLLGGLKGGNGPKSGSVQGGLTRLRYTLERQLGRPAVENRALKPY